MTTTLEQFREQCAKTIELFDDATMRESDYMLSADECADIIRALPLPVMPQQAEPIGYQYRMKPYHLNNWYEWQDCPQDMYQWCLENPRHGDRIYEVRQTFAQDPSALLARVAELEARITQVKDQFAKYESSANDNDIDMMFEYDELKKLIEG